MNGLPLSSRIRNALTAGWDRTIIEDAGVEWRLTGAQLAGAAGALWRTLQAYAERPLVAYLKKGPLYYAFTTCAFLRGLDFCPLDSDNPIHRVLDIARQLSDALILCDCRESFDQLRQHTENCLALAPLIAPAPQEQEADSGSREGRYYIATSGSTGPPKLVQVPHSRTLPFIDWATPFYAINPNTRWAQFSNIGFDLSLVDFLTVVCGGGTLVSLSSGMDRILPARAVSRCHITHWHSVPSMIPYFLREPGQKDDAVCRLFSFCGEPLMRADVENLAARYPHARIVNTYGPTEGTLFCSFYEYMPGDTATSEASIPIGEPIPSWNFVLQEEGDVLKLILLSNSISDGYVGLHSRQFAVADLFGKSIRAFDTGDYFRRVGKHLYFSHRKDGMVKINGVRIDLGEVESAAKRAGLVNPVAGVVNNSITLVAEGLANGVVDMRAELAKYLPRASVPATIQYVAAHARTMNGKLDRNRILSLAGAAGAYQ